MILSLILSYIYRSQSSCRVVQFHLCIYFDASGSVVELLFSLGDASVGSRDFDGSKGRQRSFYL